MQINPAIILYNFPKYNESYAYKKKIVPPKELVNIIVSLSASIPNRTHPNCIHAIIIYLIGDNLFISPVFIDEIINGSGWNQPNTLVNYILIIL